MIENLVLAECGFISFRNYCRTGLVIARLAYEGDILRGGYFLSFAKKN